MESRTRPPPLPNKTERIAKLTWRSQHSRLGLVGATEGGMWEWMKIAGREKVGAFSVHRSVHVSGASRACSMLVCKAATAGKSTGGIPVRTGVADMARAALQHKATQATVIQMECDHSRSILRQRLPARISNFQMENVRHYKAMSTGCRCVAQHLQPRIP
uniref:Uncharacterized protein n=1 Tax=Physcomitrium patens TaxID=3218 RepID=A0A7I3ZNC1_PHYPA